MDTNRAVNWIRFSTIDIPVSCDDHFSNGSSLKDSVEDRLLSRINSERAWEYAVTVIKSIAIVDWSFFILTLVIQQRLCFNKNSGDKDRLLALENAARVAGKAILGLVLMLILSIFLTPILLGFFVYSRIIRVLLWIKYGDSVRPAAAQDAIWAGENKLSPPFVNVAMIMDGTPSLRKIAATVRKKFLDPTDGKGNYCYPKFRETVVIKMGYFVWVKAPKFVLKNHVRYWQDPESNKPQKDPEDEATRINKLVCRFMNDQGWLELPRDTPQWEIVVLRSNQIPKDKYITIVRLHHCLGDGISLMRLILGKLIDRPFDIMAKGPPKLNPFLKMIALFHSVCVYPMEFLPFYSSRDVNPLHDGPLVGKKMYSISPSIPLNTIKKIKNATGSTVNDVLMSCFSAAYANTFGEKTEKNLTVLMPLSNHEKNEPLSPVNHILLGLMKLPIHVDNPSSSRARLSEVKAQCDILKSSSSLLSSNLGIRMIMSIIPAAYSMPMMSMPGLSMGISNVPGPQESISMWGDEVTDMAYWVPDVDPVGAGSGMMSYCGKVRMTIMADQGMSATQQQLDQLALKFNEEVNSLMSTTGYAKARQIG